MDIAIILVKLVAIIICVWLGWYIVDQLPEKQKPIAWILKAIIGFTAIILVLVVAGII